MATVEEGKKKSGNLGYKGIKIRIAPARYLSKVEENLLIGVSGFGIILNYPKN